MNNLVPLNNNIFQDIVQCFNSQYWTIGHALCTWPNRRVCVVFDDKTHCIQSYNQGYRKTSNN